MLHLKLKELIEKKGQMKANKFLVKSLNISTSVAVNLLNGTQTNIQLKTISKICAALNCTPNDLFYWNNTQTPIDDNHVLRTELTLPEKLSNWQTILNTLPQEEVEKLFEQAKQVLKEIKK